MANIDIVYYDPDVILSTLQKLAHLNFIITVEEFYRK